MYKQLQVAKHQNKIIDSIKYVKVINRFLVTTLIS